MTISLGIWPTIYRGARAAFFAGATLIVTPVGVRSDGGLAHVAAVTPAARATPAVETAMALRYEHGEGVPRDYAHALELYCDAASRGDGDAAYDIGWMFLNGRGRPRDDGSAAAWFRIAAALGNPQAANLLERLSLSPTVAPADCADADYPRDLAAPGSSASRKIAALVGAAARRFGLDPDLIFAVMAVESSFRGDAISPRKAEGLMQLMPETARRFGVENVDDPAQNIEGGAKYLRWLLAYFKGDIVLVLAAYNAGEGAVTRYGGVPPYPETRAYVKKIRGFYASARQGFDLRALAE
jgi:soluble lytic murein transglycosylase-like protein